MEVLKSTGAKRGGAGEANGHAAKKGPAAAAAESDSSSSDDDDDDDSAASTRRGPDDDDDDDDEGEKPDSPKPDSPLKALLHHAKRELLLSREMAKAYKAANKNATALAQKCEEANAYLKAAHERQVMRIAKYEMQFCTRTVVHGLLRLALRIYTL